VEYLKGRSDHFGGLLKLKFVLQKEKVKVWNEFSCLKIILSDGSIKDGISSKLYCTTKLFNWLVSYYVNANFAQWIGF
jgi:hypothetical protein